MVEKKFKLPKKQSDRIVVEGYLSWDDAAALWWKNHDDTPHIKYEYEHPNKKTTVISKKKD